MGGREFKKERKPWKQLNITCDNNVIPYPTFNIVKVLVQFFVNHGFTKSKLKEEYVNKSLCNEHKNQVSQLRKHDFLDGACLVSISKTKLGQFNKNTCIFTEKTPFRIYEYNSFMCSKQGHVGALGNHANKAVRMNW